MKIQEIVEILDAELLWGEHLLEYEVETACASDLMSDILAETNEKHVMLTGLINSQVIRTAEMIDMCVVVFTRGKRPGDDILALAKEREIAVVCTKNSQFISAGKLYERGLGKPGGINGADL